LHPRCDQRVRCPIVKQFVIIKSNIYIVFFLIWVIFNLICQDNLEDWCILSQICQRSVSIPELGLIQSQDGAKITAKNCFSTFLNRRPVPVYTRKVCAGLPCKTVHHIPTQFLLILLHILEICLHNACMYDRKYPFRGHYCRLELTILPRNQRIPENQEKKSWMFSPGKSLSV